MTNLPKSVAICGKTIRFVYEEGMDDFGTYLHDESTIKLAGRVKQNRKLLKDTIRHEMMHAVLWITGVAFLERFEEETLVRCMDEVFFPVWEKFCKKHQF